MAGAMCRWMLIALPARLAFTAEVPGMALHHARRECRRGPLPHTPQTLGKSRLARGVLRLPHPLLALSTRVASRVGGPSPDVAQRLEQTEAPRALGDQGLPSALRRLPALGLDGLRRLRGIHGLRFVGKNALRFCPVDLGGGRGHGGPQETVVRCGRGARPPRTMPPALLCLRHQVLGAGLGALARRADAPAAPPTVFQTIPGHRLAAQPGSHGPTGHRQSPQAQRMVDVVGTPRHRRQDKGGGARQDRTALRQTHAATQAWLFARGRRRAEEGLAPWKCVRQQRGTRLVELCKSGFGRGAIREKTVLGGLGPGEADRPVSVFGRRCSRGHAFLEVRRCAWGCKPNISQSGAAFNPTSDHQQNPLQPVCLHGFPL
jgi:hypothetical protein